MPERDTEILRRYEAGERISDIEQSLDCSRGTIYAALRRADIEPDRQVKVATTWAGSLDHVQAAQLIEQLVASRSRLNREIGVWQERARGWMTRAVNYRDALIVALGEHERDGAALLVPPLPEWQEP